MPACPGTGSEPLSRSGYPAAANGEPLPATRADPARPLGHVPAPITVLDRQSFEVGIPNVARIYDALLGGKDNYAVDREAALALTAAIPSAARAARDNREFLGRAVHFLAAEAGITQFLDIGTGLPTQGNVHEIAQAVNRCARVVYVDNDPVVLAHGRALLADNPNVHVVEGDLEYPRELLGRKEVRQRIDFSKPVAVLLVAVLHFLDDSLRPWEILEAITHRIAPASYVVISHVTGDQISAEAASEAREIYADFAQGTTRSRARIMSFFEGLELVPPGLIDVADWRPGRDLPTRPTLFWGGVGCKPGMGDDQ
ncbi:MAG: SAM-dependent methyltransferase [Streptosporangiaceae bacterium]